MKLHKTTLSTLALTGVMLLAAVVTMIRPMTLMGTRAASDFGFRNTGGLSVARIANVSFKSNNPQSAIQFDALRRPQSKSPWINLRDGVDLRTTYIGSVGLKLVLEQNLAVPLALASADFDEDGVPDLVSGYAGPSGGIVTLHRGNVEALWPQPQEGRGAEEPRSRGVEGPRSWKKDISLAPPHPSSPAPSLPSPPAPFLPSADVFETPDPPDFLGAGDFDADGHWDVVTAARGSDRLQFLRGNGHGELQSARAIELPGAVTTMVTGEINRRDGLDDVIVGIVGRDGPKVLVFEGPEGAFGKAERGMLNDEQANGNPQSPIRNPQSPEVIPIPAEAAGLALGQLDESYEMDLAVAAGTELLIVHGRDRRLSWDEAHRAEVAAATVDQRSFSFTIRSLALGDFVRDEAHQTDIALLAEDGTIHVLANPEPSEASATVGASVPGRPRFVDEQNAGAHRGDTSVGASVSGRPRLVDAENAGAPRETPRQASVGRLEGWRSDMLTTNSWPQATRLFAVKTSSLPTDDLVVLDPASHQLHVLMTGDETQSAIRNLKSAIAAVLPMRLNVDALNDLVILESGQSAPTIAMTMAAMTFTVNSTADDDDGDCNGASGDCTLREAINAANANPGADTIQFNLGTGTPTITLGSSLPTITDPITINGNTGGATRVEINGNSAAFDGLRIAAGRSTVRALVINRCTDDGIDFDTNGGNLVENCFIGTNAAGSADLGNSGNGVDTGLTNGNTIGGTMGAMTQNVISGNNTNGIGIGNATGNLVQGNYIGTDVTGTIALGNTRSGVLVTGPNNIIGGTTSGARNIISGNNSYGVETLNGEATMNQVQGNYIGTDVTGTIALGNTRSGVLISGTAGGASSNTIGGTAMGAGNTIAFNGGNGVSVDVGKGNRIAANSIHSNTGVGIDLAPNGVTPNDATDSDSGPNNLQNFPVLTSAAPGATTTIAGSINSAGGGGNNATYPITIEFFSSKVCNGDVNGTATTSPNDFGEGQTFLGSTTVPSPSGPSPFTFTATSLSPVPVGHTVVTATATDANGNTSEFSKCLPINQPPVAKCKDVIVPAGADCTASASINDGSFDPDGTITKTQQTPPGPYPVGITKVTLTVTDNAGASSMCMANVTVTNAAPTANAGPDQTVNSGATVTLNGAGSTDPGQSLTYMWTQKAGTTVTLNNANTPTPTFTAPKTCSPSLLTFELKVTDPCGAMATDTVDVTVSPPACFPLPADNVLWLTGDNTPNDISGQNNHGTWLGGSAAYVPSGKVGPAFSLNGSAYVEVKNKNSLNPETGGFTVDAWIYADPLALSGDQPIIDKSSGFGNGYKLVIAGGKLGFQAGGAGGAFGNPTLIDGQWHHVALALTPNPPKNYFLYLDGKEITSGGMSSYNVDSALDLWIGRSHSSPTFFRGFIDEVEIFKRTLTGDEIKAIYDADCAGKCKPADLMTTKTHTGDFLAGQNGVYAITVKNVGSGPAASPIMVTDTLPVGVLYVSDSGSPWSCTPSTVPPNPQTVKCTYTGPALQPGDSTPPLNLTVNILPAVIFLEPKITNCVEITSPKDANADNDKACDSTTVVLPPDLKITKTASPNPVVVGSKLTYTITVMNSGPNAATSVVVTDTLPSNATYVAGSCTATSGGDCSSFGSNGKVTFASLAANTSATITFMVTVNCSVTDGAMISNTASIASSLPDLDPSNNSATATVTAKSTSPTANAGPDQVVNSGQSVMLDGSKSGPAGSLTYQWTQTGVPSVTLANANTPTPTFTAPPTCSPLMLTFQLKVTTDPCGAMATDTVVVTVNPASCTPAPSGLVEWLSFDEARGPRANDLSGQGNHGTHTNAPTPFASGKVAGALDFDGTNDYVVVSDEATLDFGFGSFTIDAWIFPDATNAIRPIVDKRRGPSSTPRGYALYLFNGRLGIQLANGTTFTNFETPSGTVAPVGQWTHVAAVIDRTKEFKVKLYINGMEVLSSSNILPGDISNTAPLWIGRNQIDDGYFDGKIDELEIFNRPLSEMEIKDIVNADCAGKCKTPPRAPDLMITKSHVGTFKPGQTAIYTITVKNVGNLSSSGQIKVTDTLPPGLTYVSGTGGGWGCTAGTATGSGQTVTCTNNASLAANASSTITLTVTVSSTIALPPNLSNCVSVETQNDSNLANNTFCDPTDITTCLNPVPSNMTNWWPGDGNANDIRGSNNGTLQNGTTFAAGKVAQAFKFDGVDDFVTFGNTIGNFGTSDFTIDFWIQTTSTRNEAILEKRAACSHASFVEFRLNVSPNVGKLFISIDQDGAGTNYNELITNKTVNDGIPHHVALVRQGTTARVYIDGQLDKSGTTSGVTNITNAASFTTGKSVCGSSATFTGLLDEIEVFDRALSQPEIEKIYNADSAGKCKPGGPPPGGSPDFVVQDLQVNPPGTSGGTVPGSSTVMVTFKIRNQGTTFAGGAQHQVLLIASPYTPTTGTVVATVLTEPLAAGAVSDTFKVTVQLPPGASPAIAARIRVVADGGNVVIELSEANNTSDFSFRIQ